MRIRRQAMRLLLPGLHRGKEPRYAYPQTVVLEKPASQDTKAQQIGEGNAATKEAQKEEQATEVQITIYKTTQQQKQKNKDDKKRKKHNHTTGWIREWLTLLTQLDGTGGHERLSKMA